MGLQFDLFTGQAVAVGSVQERIKHLLRTQPATRNSYDLLTLRYWVEFDGLENVLAVGGLDTFCTWFLNHATCAKTLRNRAMEVQREHPELAPSPEVRAWRDKQATAGPVGA